MNPYNFGVSPNVNGGSKIKLVNDALRELQDWKNSQQTNQPLSYEYGLQALLKLYNYAGISSLVPLLSHLLTLKGQPMTLDRHFMFEPMFDRYAVPQRTLLKCGRQCGKSICILQTACHIQNSWYNMYMNKIYLSNGKRISIEEIKVGDEVVSVDETSLKTTFAKVVDKHSSGIKTVYKVKTRMGSELILANTHPLMKLNKWEETQHLKVGDRLAAVRTCGKFLDIPADRDRIILTAYVIGDGCCVNTKVGFTSAEPLAYNEFIEIAQKYQTNTVWVGTPKTSPITRQIVLSSTNKLTSWLAEDDMITKYSYEKTIPDWVFNLSKEDTALFISKLWATDGSIKLNDISPAITYCSSCPDLVYQIKSLLLKFGIMSNIRSKATGYKKDGVYHPCRTAYELRVEGYDSWKTFMSTFDVPGKPNVALPEVDRRSNRDTIPLEVREILKRLAEGAKYKHSRKDAEGNTIPSFRETGLRVTCKYPLTMPKLDEYIAYFDKFIDPSNSDLVKLKALRNGDIYWDEIISIEKLKDKECWDIEVETHHNYVMDGILTHNSQSIAAQSIIQSALMPNFNTIFVCPLYEQIRRFSSNYVRPLIMDSPIKSLIVSDSVQAQNVLQRSLSNGSIMFFTFCFLDAERVRGISASKMVADESTSGDTQIGVFSNGCVKNKFIKDVKPGEIIKSFTRNGTICYDRVKKVSYHGYRKCFTIRTRSGKELTSTAESWLATTKDWKRVSDVIEQSATPTNIGYPLRGRMYEVCSKTRVLYQQSRMDSARIQLSEIPDIITVREYSNREIRESGLREMVEQIQYPLKPGIRLLQEPVLQNCSGENPSSEIYNPELVGSNYSRRLGMVDRGRWKSKSKGLYNYPSHRGLFRGRSKFTKGLAIKQVSVRGLYYPHPKSKESRKDLSYSSFNRRQLTKNDRARKALHTQMYGVQDYPLPSDKRSPLLLLQSKVYPWTKSTQTNYRKAKKVLLSKERMPFCSAQNKSNEIHDSREENREESKISTKVSSGYREVSGIQSKISQKTKSFTSRALQELQTKAQSKGKATKISKIVDLSKMWSSRTSRRQIYRPTVLCKMSGISNKGATGYLQSKSKAKKATKERNHFNALHLLSDTYTSSQEWSSHLLQQGMQETTHIKNKKTRICRNEASRAGNSTTLSTLQDSLSERKEWEGNHVLSELQKGGSCQKDTRGLCLEETDIVSITYAGYHDVWDLETENNNCFLANGIAVHNCQDIDWDFLPIIQHCLAASEYELEQYTGTPKTFDNTIQMLWEQSSQAEWVIPCDCGYWNTCTINLDLDQMIQRAGLSCRKCGRLLDSRTGHYEHMYPEKRSYFAGYHVPQPIVPIHFDYRDQERTANKWYKLFMQREKSKSAYYNECLGESCDAGTKLISLSDLQRAAVLPWGNTIKEALEHRNEYSHVTMGVDWGGGAGGIVRRKKGTIVVEGGSPSFTVVTIVGFKHGSITPHVLYTERLNSSYSPQDEIKIIMDYYNRFNCYRFAHDFGGSGAIREAMLFQAGFPPNVVFPCQYVRASSKNICVYQAPANGGSRYYYSIDKARSIALLCQIIKSDKGLLFPKCEWNASGEGRYELILRDFLALIEDKHENVAGSDVFLIVRNPKMPDDFVHSLNYACVCHWHGIKEYPNLAEQFGIGLTDAQKLALDPNPSLEDWSTH